MLAYKKKRYGVLEKLGGSGIIPEEHGWTMFWFNIPKKGLDPKHHLSTFSGDAA